MLRGWEMPIYSLLISDLISEASMILIFSSIFLVVAIITSLSSHESYILAKGWLFLLPAVLVIAIIRIYDFSLDYGFSSIGKMVHELLYLTFGVFLFASLLIQFLAIRQTIESRKS